jgi:hypothetical protein
VFFVLIHQQQKVSGVSFFRVGKRLFFSSDSHIYHIYIKNKRFTCTYDDDDEDDEDDDDGDDGDDKDEEEDEEDEEDDYL